MSGAQDWIDDLTDASDGGDDGPSLFEDNFRKMLEDNDIESMTLQTLEGQIERINDPELLADAIEADDRKGAEEIYRNRIGEINSDNIDESDDADGSDDAVEMGDEEEQAEVDEVDDADEGEDQESTGDDVLNDLVDGEDESDGDVEEVEWGGEGDHPPGLDEADDAEGTEDARSDSSEDSEPEEDQSPSEDDESAETGRSDSSGIVKPDVDVSSLAPNAVERHEAAQQTQPRTLFVWGTEGTGKTHIGHTAPAPVCAIDTEGKAAELAPKFDDKEIFYWVVDDYREAIEALEEALALLDAYAEEGIIGTLVVDSMTVMWEYAQVDYAKIVYQTEKLSEVDFKSALQNEKDWTKIKARHNEEFRDRILQSGYNVVMTAGEREAYGDDFEAEMEPDGEKHNKYAVKEVVRVRVDEDGQTVADLRKAAQTRYAFVGLEWPTWDKIYDAIRDLYSAEQAPDEVPVDDWEFDVVKGQPVSDPSDGGGGDDGD